MIFKVEITDTTIILKSEIVVIYYTIKNDDCLCRRGHMWEYTVINQKIRDMEDFINDNTVSWTDMIQLLKEHDFLDKDLIYLCENISNWLKNKMFWKEQIK